MPNQPSENIISDQPSDNIDPSTRFLFDLLEYWRLTDPKIFQQFVDSQRRYKKSVLKLIDKISTPDFPKKLLDQLLDFLKQNRALEAHIQRLSTTPVMQPSKLSQMLYWV